VAGWRRKALELFPERTLMVREPGGVYTLLRNLLAELEHAYRMDAPDREFIERVYEFAAWCFGPRQNPYLRNAVAVSFYEHLPAFGPARSDLARQFTPTMWSELQPLLHQMLPPRDYDAFAAEIHSLGHDRTPQASSRRI
jgi:hypothetical protein